jgi:limonene-1,2-epoxide hydrolase
MGNGEGPRGREAVEAFYRNMIAGGGNHFQLDIRRIVADADAVVTECVMRQPMAGNAVLTAGVEVVEGEAVSADQSYLAECQVLTIWPRGANGRLEGEDIYMGSSPMARLRRLV